MREIKFRGKAVETNEWVYGSLIQCEVSGKEYIFPKGNEVNESEKIGEEGCLSIFTYEIYPETRGQYIGRKDTKGREIYEGDIIKGFFNNSSAEKSIGRIEYDNCCFVVTLEFEYGQLGHTRFDIEDCEFLGNIHDNPELLKEVKE